MKQWTGSGAGDLDYVVHVKPRTQSGVQPRVTRSPPSSRRVRVRRKERVQTDLAVLLVAEGVGCRGRCINLSLGGMAVACALQPKVGSRVQIWLTLPEGDVLIGGVARWVTDDVVGIQHDSMGALHTFELTEYIAARRAALQDGSPQQGC